MGAKLGENMGDKIGIRAKVGEGIEAKLVRYGS
jgi:hypothetical protein